MEITKGIFQASQNIYQNNKGSLLRTVIYTIGHFAIAITVLMIRRPPRSTPKPSSAASDVYKRQEVNRLEYTLWLVFLRVLLETDGNYYCLLYTSPSPRDRQKSRMPSSA